MFHRYHDKENRFYEIFNTRNGHYMRTGVYEGNVETNKDPFMRSFPNLLDIGIMGHCVHGKSGLCAKSGIQCYQNGAECNNPNMSFEDFKKILDECIERNNTDASGVYQVALGGCGDPDMHENFEEMLEYCHNNDIIPNFTTSGLGMTPEKAAICKRYCGAVAVSMYSRLDLYPQIAFRQRGRDEEKKPYATKADIPTLFTFGNVNKSCYFDPNRFYINNMEYDFFEEHHLEYSDLDGRYELYRVYEETESDEKNYTFKAVNLLLNAGVHTNIHFVLSKATISEAIVRLENNGFPEGINAVIFLLHKPIGQGTEENVLSFEDPEVKKFFSLIDSKKFPFKIGFDSCSIPGLINYTKTFDYSSFDTCEGGRWSAYVTSDMKLLPCSFDNQEQKWAVDIKNNSIYDAWHSKEFEDFRKHFKTSCHSCSNRNFCMGGCPIVDSIVLCNKPERTKE